VKIDYDGNNRNSCRIGPEDRSDEERFSLKKMDRLDKMTIFALCVILLTGALLVTAHSARDETAGTVHGVSRQAVVIVSPEFDNKLKIAENLLSSGNLAKARELIDGMIDDYPYDGRPYILLGDLYVREQQPVLAMLEYRKGVDLNPDFLDKKAKLFRGKQIKNILEEARANLTAGLEEKPDDSELKERLEILYYMLRRVAGSCG
jgi:tetratricopeptide (TPR) repeat protein